MISIEISVDVFFASLTHKSFNALNINGEQREANYKILPHDTKGGQSCEINEA